MKISILLIFKIDFMLAFLKHPVSVKYLIMDYFISNEYILSETGLLTLRSIKEVVVRPMLFSLIFADV